MTSIKESNQSLSNYFNPRFKYLPTNTCLSQTRLYSNGSLNLNGIWEYLNAIKVITANVLPQETWKDVKLECDELFKQASEGKYNICPAYILGGFGKKE